MLVLAVMKSRVARCRTWSRLTDRWWSKSKSSMALRAGNPAARIRLAAPWALRVAASASRQAARYSWCVQPPSRAAAASRSAESRSEGALRTRAR